jgi:hypothetical protein
MATALLDQVRGKMGQPLLPIDVEKVISHMKLVPTRVRQTWNDVVQIAVRENRCEELHAAREEFKTYIDEQIAILEWVASGKMLAGRGHPFGRLNELEQPLSEIKSFREGLFSRWTSLDDLFALVIQDFRYSKEKFQAYDATHPIPQSWYEETDDLFTPAPE